MQPFSLPNLVLCDRRFLEMYPNVPRTLPFQFFFNSFFQVRISIRLRVGVSLQSEKREKSRSPRTRKNEVRYANLPFCGIRDCRMELETCVLRSPQGMKKNKAIQLAAQ